MSKYVGSSSARYEHRLKRWRKHHRVFPGVRHHLWWLLHNVASHPILGFTTSAGAVWFHDWTSQHLNHRDHLRPSPPPKVAKRFLWLKHNVFGHLAIGMFPVEASFRFHDRTAADMDVPDWV